MVEIELDHDRIKGDNREQVIPRRLLRNYDLWEERLTLVNRISIPYREVTIPCCNACRFQVIALVLVLLPSHI